MTTAIGMPSLPSLGLLFLIIFLTYKWMDGRQTNKMRRGDNLMDVPDVQGGRFLFGHAMEMQDMVKFAQKCCKIYGKIFKFKLFQMTVVMIADRSLAQEYYKAKEDTLKGMELLIDISFFDAVCPSFTVHNGNHYLDLIRKTHLGARYENLLPKVRLSSEQFVSKIRDKINKSHDVNLVDECLTWGTTAMALCATGVQFNDAQVAKVAEFTNAMEKMVVSAAILPRWARKLIFQRKLDRLRFEIGEFIHPAIKAHLADPTLKDSEFIRLALDMNERGVCSFTDQEIADATFMAITADINIGIGVNTTLVELALRKDLWAKLKDELAPAMASGAMGDVLMNPLLNACILESVRVNPKLILTWRKPAWDRAVAIGAYDVSDADVVTICVPALQVLDPVAGETYLDPGKFDPERFLLRKEPSGPPCLNTWGGGAHRCPGQKLSVAMMKIAMAHFITNFTIEFDDGGLPSVDYNGLAAFPKKVLPGCKVRISQA